MRGGKQALFFSIFPLQTEANSSDLLSRPRGLADMEALACSLPSSQVVWSCGWQELMAKARAATFFLNHILLFFFHLAALYMPVWSQVKWWKCSCQSASFKKTGMSEVSVVLWASSLQGTQTVDFLLFLLCQSRRTHSGWKKKKNLTALPLTLRCAQSTSVLKWKNKDLSLCLAGTSWEKGLVWWALCIIWQPQEWC